MSPGARNALTIAASLGGVALVATVIGALTEGPPAPERPSPTPSTFFSDPPGARALLLVVQRFLPSTAPWRRPLTNLPDPPMRERGPTLIAAGPSEGLSAAEADALDGWLSEGGQLILCVDKDWDVRDQAQGFLARHGVSVEAKNDAEDELRTVRAACLPDEPLALRIPKGRRVRGSGKGIARDGDDVLALAVAVGRGRILVLPDASFVSNASLRGSDNAVLLVALCSQWADAGVLFDEYHHGFGESRGDLALMAALMATPWGWMLATAMAAGALYVFGCRRRFGRIVEPATPSRQDPMQTVDARAGLFRTAGARDMAVDLFCVDLEHGMGLALGRPVDLAELLREHRANPSARTERGLERLIALREAARQGRRVGEREVVEAARLAGSIQEEAARG